MIPLGHDFTGERVLVVGGGAVGARKARTFAREARTVVVSPTFADRSFGDAELVRAAPAPDAVGDWVRQVDPKLVVAATDDRAVNDAVADAARVTDTLLNRADRSATPADTTTDDRQKVNETSETSDASGRERTHEVTTLATVRSEPVVVGVSTGGTSPALARELRRRIEPELAGAGDLATLLTELRPEAKRRGNSTERRAAMRAIVGAPAVWKGLGEGESNAREEARRLLNEYV